jgi:hypothetical protein
LADRRSTSADFGGGPRLPKFQNLRDKKSHQRALVGDQLPGFRSPLGLAQRFARRIKSLARLNG